MKKRIKEDIGDIVKNITGDKVRAMLGSIPGLNVIVGGTSIVLNYSDLNDTMEEYEELLSQFEEGERTDNLYDKFVEVEKKLKVDFIDMLQAAGEMGIPGFRMFNIFGAPLFTALTIEEILDEISKFLPFEEDAKDSLFPYLAAIKQIGEMKKSLKQFENPENVLDTILPPIPVTEGRKKTGTKLCSRGKSAAKSKFDVYPSAYANGYAIQVCKGKIKGLDGKKRCSPPYC